MYGDMDMRFWLEKAEAAPLMRRCREGVRSCEECSGRF